MMAITTSSSINVKPSRQSEKRQHLLHALPDTICHALVTLNSFCSALNTALSQAAYGACRRKYTFFFSTVNRH